MNITNSEFRARARAALGGQIFARNWLMAVVVVLIISAITGIASSIPVASLILTGPLAVGSALVFLKLMRTGEEIKIEDAFAGFKDFAGTLLLGLMYTIFVFLWKLLLIVPGIVKSYSYAMCFYIKNDHPEYDWKQCITESRKMMDGYKWKLFCLDFSFIGWMIVGVLCFGVGILWVSAYMESARAAFYNELKGEEPVAEESAAEEPTADPEETASTEVIE